LVLAVRSARYCQTYTFRPPREAEYVLPSLRPTRFLCVISALRAYWKLACPSLPRRFAAASSRLVPSAYDAKAKTYRKALDHRIVKRRTNSQPDSQVLRNGSLAGNKSRQRSPPRVKTDGAPWNRGSAKPVMTAPKRGDFILATPSQAANEPSR
jgi:hypothetical protein